MDHQPARHSARVIVAFVALAVGVVAAACQKAEATTSTETSSSGSPGQAVAMAPAYHEASFDLTMTPKGPYKSGQLGEVQVVLEAKGEFHVNDKYPIRLKLKPSNGIKYPAPVVTKEQVTLEHKRAVMKVALTPESSGKKQVSGELAFSICTEKVCVMENRGLTQAIDVN